MSGIKPHVLYETLLEDLQRHTGLARKDLSILTPQAPGLTVDEAAAVSMAAAFLKKNVTTVSSDADEKALSKFTAANIKCGSWTPSWGTSWEDELMGCIRFEAFRFFDCDSLTTPHSSTVLSVGGVGPGVSLPARDVDFYTKLFDSPLGYSDRQLYCDYKQYVKGFQRWRFAENRRTKRYGETLEEYSKLSFVPKSNAISRTICAEPTLNIMFQLGYGELISRRLKSWFGVDIKNQQWWNRHLAWVGSLPFGPRFATLDLESASDLNSVAMLKWLLPKRVNWYLDRYRSSKTKLSEPLCEIDLQMVSSMGNGFTFPLMTAIFCCVIAGAYRMLGIKPTFRGSGVNAACFGDDIIIIPEAWHLVTKALSLMGHTVNASKSFFEGPFRESCGADFIHGRNIRGVYCKSQLATAPETFVLANRLNDWSAMTGIPCPGAVSRLLAAVRVLPVPRWEADDCGYRIPMEIARQWSSKLAPKVQGTFQYRKLEAKPMRITVGFSSITAPKKGKKLVFRSINPDGLVLSFLNSTIRKQRISVRSDGCAYVLRNRLAPNWDLISAFESSAEMHEEERRDGWSLSDVSRMLGSGNGPTSGWMLGALQRWDTAVRINSGELSKEPL
jgi:hypothetical protein